MTALNILVIDAWLPTPDRDAASLQMVRVLELVQEFGTVTFGADDFAARRSGLERMQAAGINVILPPESIVEHLTAHGNTYDVVLLSRIQIADKYFPAARTHAPRAKIIFDTTDLAYVREFRAAKVLGNMNLLRRALETRKTELAIMRAADITLVVSTAERDMLAQDCPEARVRVLIDVHDVVSSTVPFGDRSGILFIGAFPHLPNADGIQFFHAEILPHVRDRLGDVTLTIVGSHPPDWLVALHSEHFIVAHHVIDLAPLLNRARVTIAPIRYGAGVKGKVLLSMSYGVPVVGTTIAAEGIPIAHRREMMIADTPESFADALSEVYTNENLWQTLAENSKQLIQQNFSRAIARATLAGIFRELELL